MLKLRDVYDIKLNGHSILDYVVSFTRVANICEGKEDLNLVLREEFGINTASIFDEITVYEEGNKVKTFYIDSIDLKVSPGQITLLATDIKRIKDYFIAENYLVDYPSSPRYWIQKFLNEAGVSVHFTTSSNGGLLSNNTSLGLTSLYEQLQTLLQISGWYMRTDENGNIVIGDLLVAHTPSKIIRGILEFERETNDSMSRNRAVVWGSADSNMQRWVYANVETNTTWQIDGKDKRTVVVSNSNIPSIGVAYRIANRVVREFTPLLDIKTVKVAGVSGLNLGDSVFLDLQQYGFKGVARLTSYSKEVSEKGAIETLVFDERCPRLFAYWGWGYDYIYVATDSGVYRKPMIQYSGEMYYWQDYSQCIQEKDIFVDKVKVIHDNLTCFSISGGGAYYRNTIDSCWKYLYNPEGYNTVGSAIDMDTLSVFVAYSGNETDVVGKFDFFGNFIRYSDPLPSGHKILDIDSNYGTGTYMLVRGDRIYTDDADCSLYEDRNVDVISVIRQAPKEEHYNQDYGYTYYEFKFSGKGLLIHGKTYDYAIELGFDRGYLYSTDILTGDIESTSVSFDSMPSELSSPVKMYAVYYDKFLDTIYYLHDNYVFTYRLGSDVVSYLGKTDRVFSDVDCSGKSSKYLIDYNSNKILYAKYNIKTPSYVETECIEADVNNPTFNKIDEGTYVWLDGNKIYFVKNCSLQEYDLPVMNHWCPYTNDFTLYAIDKLGAVIVRNMVLDNHTDTDSPCDTWFEYDNNYEYQDFDEYNKTSWYYYIDINGKLYTEDVPPYWAPPKELIKREFVKLYYCGYGNLMKSPGVSLKDIKNGYSIDSKYVVYKVSGYNGEVVPSPGTFGCGSSGVDSGEYAEYNVYYDIFSKDISLRTSSDVVVSHNYNDILDVLCEGAISGNAVIADYTDENGYVSRELIYYGKNGYVIVITHPQRTTFTLISNAFAPIKLVGVRPEDITVGSAAIHFGNISVSYKYLYGAYFHDIYKISDIDDIEKVAFVFGEEHANLHVGRSFVYVLPSGANYVLMPLMDENNSIIQLQNLPIIADVRESDNLAFSGNIENTRGAYYLDEVPNISYTTFSGIINMRNVLELRSPDAVYPIVMSGSEEDGFFEGLQYRLEMTNYVIENEHKFPKILYSNGRNLIYENFNGQIEFFQDVTNNLEVNRINFIAVDDDL